MRIPFKRFSETEHETWRELYSRQNKKRGDQMVDQFSAGLEVLKIGSEKIPDLDQVNRLLRAQTGFSGVPVEGLKEPISFFKMLSQREFPIGNFIRDSKDLNYTPAPDVFHDLYGHLPFFADQRYADFCAEFGRRALRHQDHPELILQFDRLFWFTIEFALIQSRQGLRIFGAGIASSYAECEYALGGQPELIPFDLERIRAQEFKIDEFQRRLFVLGSSSELYRCLPAFEEGFWFSGKDQAVS